MKHTVGFPQTVEEGKEGGREGAVQVHREGKLLHEYKSKERGGGMALAEAAASAMAMAAPLRKSAYFCEKYCKILFSFFPLFFLLHK